MQVGTVVALASERHRRQIRGVSLQHDVVERNLLHSFRYPGILERDHASDSYRPVSIFLESHERLPTSAVRVHIASESEPFASFQHLEKVIHRVTFMYIHRQIQFVCQSELCLQCLFLQFCSVFRIMVIQSDFSDRHDSCTPRMTLSISHILLPILIHRPRIKPDHIPEKVRMSPVQVEHFPPFFQVNVRLYYEFHSCLTGFLHNLVLFPCESLIVHMRVRIYICIFSVFSHHSLQMYLTFATMQNLFIAFLVLCCIGPKCQ